MERVLAMLLPSKLKSCVLSSKQGWPAHVLQLNLQRPKRWGDVVPGSCRARGDYTRNPDTRRGDLTTSERLFLFSFDMTCSVNRPHERYVRNIELRANGHAPMVPEEPANISM